MRERLDGFSWMLCFVLVLVGWVMVYSASYMTAIETYQDGYYFFKKQVLFSGLGVLACMLFFKFPLKKLEPCALPLYVLSLILLILIWTPLGVKVGGASRWLQIGPLRFQPSECVKLTWILACASLLSKPGSWKTKWHFFFPLLWLSPACIALLLQPDFGTSVLLLATTFSMMFLRGLPWKHALAGIAVGISVLGLLIAASGYRSARWSGFLDPWQDPQGKGFQMLQSFTALHQGGLAGAGLGHSQAKLFFLPESHNDFLLAVIGEELGYFGLLSVLFALGFLAARLSWLAWRQYRVTHNRFHYLLCQGLLGLLLLQSWLHAGVILGLLPTKGLPLPFLSYGGSSMVFHLLSIAIVLRLNQGAEKWTMSERRKDA